jgi:hypothetical protein
VIFRQGDDGSSLFIIEEGAVDIAFGEGSEHHDEPKDENEGRLAIGSQDAAPEETAHRL